MRKITNPLMVGVAVASMLALTNIASAGAFLGSSHFGQVSGCGGGGCGGGCCGGGGFGGGCCGGGGLGGGCGCLGGCGGFGGCLGGAGGNCWIVRGVDCDDCSCNGSYNYPVPPHYTYHWPGCQYKQQRMTDYQSPWRFPPIKAFEEDLPNVNEMLPPAAHGYTLPFDPIRPVSSLRVLPRQVRRVGDVERMSEKIRRHYQ